MTDKEKLHQILSSLWKNDDSADKTYYNQALQDIQTAIELQEEPVFKVGDTIQKKDNNSIRYSIINKTSDGYRALRGLSDTILIWFSEQDQWELVEEPVNEDLEKASMEWLAPQLDKSYAVYGEVRMMEPTKFDGYAMLDAIEFGAKWQKEQIIAKTIDGKILEVEDNDCAICSHTHLELCIEPDTLEKNGFKDNDKVKVFIIKEN